MAIFSKYNIVDRLPGSVVSYIEKGMAGKYPETPKAMDRIFENAYNLVIGSNIEAIMTARKKADELGYHTLILSSMIEGETREVARTHTAIAREVLKTGNPLPRPACILSGGETTVTITGKGLGGRNQEFVLAAAPGIAGRDPVVILSAGTDGNDGPTEAAGAIADASTMARAAALKLDPGAFLSQNDSYHFFKKLDDLLITGPTNTNVMDLRIMLIA
jgi:hydroxypyruvate reductase